jgi:FkbM family methyltransferase
MSPAQRDQIAIRCVAAPVSPASLGAVSRRATIARTRTARLLSRMTAERRAPLERPLRPWLEHGTYAIAGGENLGLLLDAGSLPLTHAHAPALLRGTVEVAVQQAFLRSIRPGARVWDIGANLGFFSLLAARLAGPEGHVVAWEPVPANAAAVRLNAKLNGFAPLIEVREEAVSSRAGHAPLHVVADASWSHLADRGEHRLTRETVDVPTVVLDDLVAAGEVDPPDFLKIDVEGSEVDVLRGARAVLAAHRPLVVCELHETNREVAAQLRGAGYTLENLDGVEPVERAGPVHVLARPA